MMNSICLLGPDGEATAFGVEEQRVWLDRLCGVPSAQPAADTAPLLAGLAELSTSIGRFEGADWRIAEATSDGNQARIAWQIADGALEWESTWSVCPHTGVVSRRDVVHNQGETAVTLFRSQARFVFPPAPWEVCAQQSHWCGENQGAWQPHPAGALRFGCVGGRTTQDGTPYVALREVNAETGLTFHLLPRGNWSIDARTRSVVNSPAFLVVTLGTSEDDLRLELPPGGSFEMPEILIPSLPQGQPHLAAPARHRFLLLRRGAGVGVQALAWLSWLGSNCAYCRLVTSHAAIQKGRSRWTRVGGRSSSAPAELPMLNSPAGMRTNRISSPSPRATVRCQGSSRTPIDHPDYAQADCFARRMREARWMVITGAGDGIMRAHLSSRGCLRAEIQRRPLLHLRLPPTLVRRQNPPIARRPPQRT
jgi:hypothetical protein